MRTAWLARLMLGVNALASPWTVRLLAFGAVAVLVAYRRFQHLAAYLVIFLAAVLLLSAMRLEIGRMRPTGIEILGPWQGYAQPSQPVATLTLALVGVLYTLMPAGRWRNRGKSAAGIILAAVCAARLYLAVEHPTDQLTALIIGWPLAVVAFWLAVPTTSSRCPTGAAARRISTSGGAADRRLSPPWSISSVSPSPAWNRSAWRGRAGSTPLRIQVRGPASDKTVLFGKLYTLSHLWSDRWYKLARTVIYGRLEDEKPFSTVRRLAEYEDHLLRLMRDAGLPTPRPYGFAEITPEREYLIVMEFFEGSQEIGHAQVDNRVIDDALRVVRRMWDAGIAHRDIKPSNILVRDGHVLLIDVAFAAVLPTPWRQAVDLANMMLTLALSSTPEHVYERALGVFAADDVAEAFAACRSITVPSQSRSLIGTDGRDLIGCFRQLAPPRRPIPVQLWNIKRVAVTAGLLAALAAAVALFDAYLSVAGLL